MRFCGNCGTRLSENEKFQASRSDSAAQFTGSVDALVGADLMERFRQAGLEATGQRRNVTVLFADLSDYTSLSSDLDSEDLYQLVQRYIQLLAGEVLKYEGIVDKILGDGLMALFGAPIAHENNAERAVRAALGMQAGIDKLNEEFKGILPAPLNIHIGLNAGSVIVGGIGSDLLMDYTAIGDTVNRANRLEEAAASGTILVSDSVFRATRVLFEFEPSLPLSLKGISQPVFAHRVLGPKTLPGSVRGLEGLQAPLIGRERELQRLIAAFRGLKKNHKGQLVLVTGEAGIGKSRLTREFKRHIDQRDIRILEGSSLTYRRSVSYWIFIDLLYHYLGLTQDSNPSLSSERLVANVQQVLGRRSGEVLPYLEHLLSLEHRDPGTKERLAFLDASQIRQQIFLALRDLLIADARRKPLVLILEDLHWADDASLDLISFLVDSIQDEPILIYAISRPNQDATLARIAEHGEKRLGGCFTSIQLQSLTPVQSERLLFELLTIPELPEELRYQILQRAAGIPFYLEEIIRNLIDEQVIYQENGSWKLVPGADTRTLRVPENLQGLILARFDRLDTSSRKILQAASVIGREFDLTVLEKVIHPASNEQFERSLANLVEKAFISPGEGKPANEYLFRHVLTSDAVYSTLLRKDRETLHGKVAEAIEKCFSDRLESQIEVLAGHFLRSARLDRALHYLILSGQKASRDYANEQAKRHYEEALRLAARIEHTPRQEALLHSGLADVLVFIGEYAEARFHYNEVLKSIELGEIEASPEEVSSLHRRVSVTHERQGEFDQALICLTEADSALLEGTASSLVEKAKIFNAIGWIHLLRGNIDAAEHSLYQALDLVEHSKQYDVIASAHNRLGAVAYQKREYESSAAHVRKSLVLRETIGDVAGVARLYNNLGLLGLIRGNLVDAENNFIQSIEILERIGDAEGIALSYTNLGLVQLDRGDFQNAEGNLVKARTTAEQIGHRYYQGLALMYLGHLGTIQFEFLAAEDMLLQSLSIFKELSATDQLIDSAFYLGENCFVQGDVEGALHWVDQAKESIESSEGEKIVSSVQQGRILRLQGAIARLRGDLEKSEELLLESAMIFGAASEPLESARTFFEIGLLARLQNEQIRARQHFQEARLIFLQIGASFDLQNVEEMLDQTHA